VRGGDNMDIAKKVKQYVDECKEREPILVKEVKVEDKYKNARDITFYRLEKENKIKLNLIKRYIL
jgi:hypothetical protein